MRSFPSLFRRTRRSATRRRTRRPALRLESLEARQLMTVNLGSIQVAQYQAEVADSSLFDIGLSSIWLNEETGVVTVNGSDNDDLVSLEEAEVLDLVPTSGGRYVARINDGIRVAHTDTRSGETVSKSYPLNDVNLVVFHGNGGDDVFINDTAVPSEANGGEGADLFFGGSGDDVLRGGDDGDTIFGGAGDDEIHGGEGDDILRGDDGDDTIRGKDGNDDTQGGDGDDDLYGGAHDDVIVGGEGNDVLYGDPESGEAEGDDTLYGSAGDDDLYGGGGTDRLEGEDGNDDLWGEDGDDHLLGGYGDDDLWGGQGGDVLEGGFDEDELRGEDGPDRLYGGGGEDELYGGDGDDGLWGGSLADNLEGGRGNDRFLMHEVKDANDTISDLTEWDVQVHFENGDRVQHDGVWFEAGAWTYDEVVEVDEAFKQMVLRTHNNKLLRTENERELTFFRVGGPEDPSSDVAWIGGDEITLTDLVFDGYDPTQEATDDFIHHAVYHEIGHNWDDENDDWGDWKDISGWQNGLFTGFQWEFDPAEESFVTNYAMTDPHEDFSETFAAYFLYDTGEAVAGGLVHLSALPQKEAFMEDFLDSLS